MALEFHKLTTHIDRMGKYLAEHEEDIDDKIDLALDILQQYSDKLEEVDRRVQDAIDKDAGYRGARPLDEPIMNGYDAAPLPESATLVATDGSQVYPNSHQAAHYYLLNIGTIILQHGSGEPPQVISEPHIFYEREYVYPQEQGLISTVTVNARRTVQEMAALAEYGWYQRDQARPLVTLLDNPLLFVMGAEVPERRQLRKIYFSAMKRLVEVRAGLAGYIDNPNSTFITRLLHLLDIPPQEVARSKLKSSGRLEGLRDCRIHERLLEPGQRSPIFVLMSPQNKEFRASGGDDLEIAFFYLNTAAPTDLRPHIARVDIPMWVANDRSLIAEMQALLYHQCQQITRRYPYVLMRADELAVVRGDETRQLNMMVNVAMKRYGLNTAESAKQASKNIARGQKTRFGVK